MGVGYTCYEITHAGEGGRGRSVKVAPPPGGAFLDAAACAEAAACRFDDIAQRYHNPADSDLDGDSRVIEVEGFGGDTGPRRFRVWTRVRREYESRPEPAS